MSVLNWKMLGKALLFGVGTCAAALAVIMAGLVVAISVDPHLMDDHGYEE